MTSRSTLHHKAYTRAFERLGIPAIPVEASNGTMGGSDSTEFVCPSESGEDDIIVQPGLRVRRQRGEGRLGAPAGRPRGGRGVRAVRAASVRHAGRADDRGPGVRLRRARRPAAQDAGLRPGRAAHAGAAARRPRPRGAEAHRRDRRGRGAPGRRRRDLRGPRRAPGIAGRGGRHVAAGDRRPGAAGPVRHGDRGQHRRRAPARRGRGAGHHRRDVGGPAHRSGRGAVRPVRPAAEGHQGHRGRAHLQARLQVHQRDGRCRSPARTASRSSRSWARYGIGVERAMAAIIEVHHDAKGIVWPAAVAPFEAVVVVAQQNDAGRRGDGRAGLPPAARRGGGRDHRRPHRAGPASSSATRSWSASRSG